MRIIKFRAWDKDVEKLRTVRQIVYWEETIKKVFVQDANEIGCFLIPEEFILEQFTGLLDCEGNEIYEGDVVTWFVNDLKRTAPVYYDEEGACFWMGEEIRNDSHKGMLVINDWLRGRYKIIGNIHDKAGAEG